MIISGTQEVQTDNEIRHLSVDGIVRPEDITSGNTINHTQIASARIEYNGRGDQSRVQKTPAGQSLVEKFSPF
jgi:flagellar L-ring protein precursor FlgH